MYAGKEHARWRQRVRWALVAAVGTCMVLLPSAAFAMSRLGGLGQMRGRRRLQLAAPETDLHSETCEQFADKHNGTVDCLKLWKPEETNLLSRCGKCEEPQGPELDFSWDSGFQRTFRDVPLEPQMSCHGVRDFTRICYFKDILWDLEEEKWVVFGDYSGVLGGMGEVLKEGEPWLRLDRCAP